MLRLVCVNVGNYQGRGVEYVNIWRDMIARNPKNHDDQWLVAAAYFADNFEPLATAQSSDDDQMWSPSSRDVKRVAPQAVVRTVARPVVIDDGDDGA